MFWTCFCTSHKIWSWWWWRCRNTWFKELKLLLFYGFVLMFILLGTSANHPSKERSLLCGGRLLLDVLAPSSVCVYVGFRHFCLIHWFWPLLVDVFPNKVQECRIDTTFIDHDQVVVGSLKCNRHILVDLLDSLRKRLKRTENSFEKNWEFFWRK